MSEYFINPYSSLTAPGMGVAPGGVDPFLAQLLAQFGGQSPLSPGVMPASGQNPALPAPAPGVLSGTQVAPGGGSVLMPNIDPYQSNLQPIEDFNRGTDDLVASIHRDSKNKALMGIATGLLGNIGSPGTGMAAAFQGANSAVGDMDTRIAETRNNRNTERMQLEYSDASARAVNTRRQVQEQTPIASFDKPQPPDIKNVMAESRRSFADALLKSGKINPEQHALLGSLSDSSAQFQESYYNAVPDAMPVGERLMKVGDNIMFDPVTGAHFEWHPTLTDQEVLKLKVQIAESLSRINRNRDEWGSLYGDGYDPMDSLRQANDLLERMQNGKVLVSYDLGEAINGVTSGEGSVGEPGASKILGIQGGEGDRDGAVDPHADARVKIKIVDKDGNEIHKNEISDFAEYLVQEGHESNPAEMDRLASMVDLEGPNKESFLREVRRELRNEWGVERSGPTTTGGTDDFPSDRDHVDLSHRELTEKNHHLKALKSEAEKLARSRRIQLTPPADKDTDSQIKYYQAIVRAMGRSK